MKEVDSIIGRERYQVYITNNFDGINACFDEHKINEKILIVIDNRVSNIYLESILKHIKDRDVHVFPVGEGEGSKNLVTINNIYEKCLEYGLSRSSAIVSVGGGITGDIAGFAASTYMRGIKLIHMPTTVMAAVDSSIGGKVGVNYKHIKNLIGSFYHPKFIYINTSVFRTLESKHISSGMAEIIKYAVLFDKSFFSYLAENSSGLLNLESDRVSYVIKKCINLKLSAIKNDMNDEKERRLLNFGHTLGHVAETMSSYTISHGEAVSIGMIFECVLSNLMCRLDNDEMLKIIKLIRKYNLGHKFDFSDTDKVFSIIKHDKKTDRESVKFILPDNIGAASVIDNIDSSRIATALKVLDEYLV